jgi:hypothetical protein
VSVGDRIDEVAILFAMREGLPPSTVRDYIVQMVDDRMSRRRRGMWGNAKNEFCRAVKDWPASNGRLITLCRERRLL